MIAVLVALIGSSALGAALVAWFQRRKTSADAALTVTQTAELSIKITTELMERMRSELSDLRHEVADQRDEIAHLGAHINVLTSALRGVGIDPPPLPARPIRRPDMKGRR